MKLFKKMAEMEIQINHEGNNAGIIFINTFLTFLSIYNILIKNKIYLLYLMMLFLETLVILITKCLVRHKYGDDNYLKDFLNTLNYFLISLSSGLILGMITGLLVAIIK